MDLYHQMKEFFNIYEEEWNYYNADLPMPFDEKIAKDFIKKYFEYGGKRRVVSELIPEMETMRQLHTVSCFFLGLLIKQKLCPNLQIVTKEDDYEFSYLWYLVCLYHDMGYIQENDWTYKYKYQRHSKDFRVKNRCNKLIGVYHYQYDDLGIIYVAPEYYTRMWYGRKYREYNRNIQFNNGIVVRHSKYSRSTVFKYLEFCKMNKEIGHYDHGIVGGLWLYDSLMKNYYKQYKNELNQNKEIDFYDFYSSDNLHFSGEQRLIFAYLADCIIAHNIWPANITNNELYHQCNLDELTLERYEKIRFTNNPILFILALADTLEPIKTYSYLELSEIEIWSGISISFDNDSIVFQIIDDRIPMNRMCDKVNALPGWIGVDVLTEESEKKLIIKCEDIQFCN